MAASSTIARESSTAPPTLAKPAPLRQIGGVFQIHSNCRVGTLSQSWHRAP
jgi:hypothetical protein